jgi:hypothetical protein
MRRRARIAGIILVGALLALAAPLRAQVCGDGVIDAGETCDPPNLTLDPVTGQVRCRIDCTACGDGVVQSNDLESCDLGSPTTCGFCLNSCRDRIFLSLACPCASDDATLVDLRADILAACQCDSASSRGAFRRCARNQLALVSGERFFPSCLGMTLKDLAHSVCGKPGAVTCCRTNAHGRKRCSIEPDAASCTPAMGGSAALGVSETCCDACP